VIALYHALLRAFYMETQENNQPRLPEVVKDFQKHAKRVISPEELELIKTIYGFNEEEKG
jgi:hypothetical protein